VVERIYTYGSVNRKLMRVDIVRSASDSSSTLPVPLQEGGKEVGTLVAESPLPDDPNRGVGLAYLHKSQWDRGVPFAASGRQISIHRD
jgi:hypothetical protein